MKKFSMMAALAFLLAPLIVPANVAHADALPEYTARILYPIPDDYYEGAEGTVVRTVNDRGDVFGRSVLYTELATVWKMGVSSATNASAGVRYTEAIGGTSAGVVAVDAYRVAGVPRAGYWQGGKLTLLQFPSTWTEHYMMAANDSAHAVVAVSNSTTSALFRTLPNGDRTAMSKSVGGKVLKQLWITGISRDGTKIAGTAYVDALPVVWRSVSGDPELLRIPAGATRAFASDVNDAGVAVGYTEDDRAIMWSPTGVPTFLPLEGHGNTSKAHAINNFGVAVGEEQDKYDPYKDNIPVVWMNGEAFNLAERIRNRSELPQFTLEEAQDINDRGQIIATTTVAGRSVAVLLTPVVPQGNPVSITTTPGYFEQNGRRWQTSCGAYSATINRCRTEIWATQITRVNGRYASKTGWFFNNLTYLPAPQSTWGTNPLANPGAWTVGGRQWKTECNTPRTGGNNCRSYILATVIKSAKQANGTWKYWHEQAWVFNNIVMFGPW